ncbi:hypothetical protein Syun_010023 [Stephania yunnanensis]|uniref:Rhamnogalacturonan lyase domain-containing protein n=1 Tax=Stephania yunnanensis TaxID=152371 RepID=A0AAP0KHL4_9MAGN
MSTSLTCSSEMESSSESYSLTSSVVTEDAIVAMVIDTVNVGVLPIATEFISYHVGALDLNLMLTMVAYSSMAPQEILKTDKMIERLLLLFSLFASKNNVDVHQRKENNVGTSALCSVQLDYYNFTNSVTLDNGLVKLTISRPAEGSLTGIQYGGMDNLLDMKSSQDSRGFILRSGVSVFYCYSIFELPTGSPALDLVQTRMVFTLRRDSYVTKGLIPVKNAYVGLPIEVESKGYQSWVQTDSNGYLPLTTLFPANTVYMVRVTDIQLGHLIYVPPRNGSTIWEIGYPDRTAPGIDSMASGADTQIYRLNPIWRGTEKYVPTTWEIKFNLGSLTSGSYTLRMALASAARSDIHVYANNLDGNHLVFQVLNLGMDNAVCRHGIHGLYRLFDIEIFWTQYSSHRPGEDMLFVGFSMII